MKWKKKRIVVEAMQWNGGKPLSGMRPAAIPCDPNVPIPYCMCCGVSVSVGDWIVTGVDGLKYPVKPNIFEATYEPVSDAGKEGGEQGIEFVDLATPLAVASDLKSIDEELNWVIDGIRGMALVLTESGFRKTVPNVLELADRLVTIRARLQCQDDQ